jgi:hypothetical protein
MNLHSEQLYAAYATLKTPHDGRFLSPWRVEKSGRHDAFRSLLCWKSLEISLSSQKIYRPALTCLSRDSFLLLL